VTRSPTASATNKRDRVMFADGCAGGALLLRPRRCLSAHKG
jgi:hypothetical protein